MNINIQKSWQSMVIGIVVLLIGIGLLVYSFLFNSNYSEKSRNYVETDAEVIGYHNNSEGLQAIVVEYVVDGKQYEKISNSYVDNPLLVGTTVRIKYNKDDPSDMIFVNDSSTIVFPIVGGIFTVIGLIFFISSAKKRKL